MSGLAPRLGAVAVSALLPFGCTKPAPAPTLAPADASVPAAAAEAPPRPAAQPKDAGIPGDHEIPGTNFERVALDGGGELRLLPKIFMLETVRDSPNVTLVAERVRATRGARAELYVDTHGSRYNPTDLIGAIENPGPNDAVFPRMVWPITDADGGTARSTLRTLAHFSVSIVVRSGDVSVERFILRPEAPSP